MKTNGFRASHRNRWLFVREGVLTIDEMVLLDFYIDKMNFSPTSEDVGTFDLDYEELKQFLNKGKSTISALNKSLIKKGFIKKINPYKYEVTNWKRYILGKVDGSDGMAFYFQKNEKSQSIGLILQNLGINFQITGKIEEDLPDSSIPNSPLIKKLIKKDINIQENKDNEITSNTIGVKEKDPRGKNVVDQFPKWVLIQQEPRTDEEYQKIQDEQSDEMKMSIEDMKWIDQNAHEFIEIKDENEEKEVVKI